MNLDGKHILLGVTGGIAAYKSVELLRLFKKAGAHVNVAATGSALKFVGKTTFEVLSENPVLGDLFADTRSSVAHIDLAVQADAVVVAPATANFIGKMAAGIADDALTTTLLAATCPVMICPSMNSDMYQNIRVQRNLDTLESDGVFVVDPDSGALACKTSGAGRLPEPWFLFDRACSMLAGKDFKGKNVLISAGPTVEAIDPVRFISNHSSGKMGYSIARAAEMRGANVKLVSGPVNLSPPVNVESIDVVSCEQMGAEMLKHLPGQDIIIKVAAVADYRPKNPKEYKIKKKDSTDEMTIELVENPDILKMIGEKKEKKQYLVGFAAETDDLKKNALLKMKKKNLDMIVANIVGQSDSGFKADTNRVRIFKRDGSSSTVPLMPKLQVADVILDNILEEISTDF